MDFPGLREDQSIYGEGALEATNVWWRRGDAIGRRPGRTSKKSVTGRTVCEFADPINGSFLVLHKDTTVNTLDLSTGTIYTATTALNSRYATFAKCQGRVYVANGFDPLKVLEDGTATIGNAGLSAPTTQIGAGSQAGGLMTDGTHLFRYRYLNSKTGFYSNPSPARSITLSGNKKVTFTVGTDITASSDGRVDKIILEATLAQGTEFYKLATCNNIALVTVDANLDDLDIGLLPVLDLGLGNDPPPAFEIVAEHRGRLWGIGFPATTATVTVASGSVTVGGSGFSTKWAGKSMVVDGETTRYTLASSSVSTAFTLETAYLGTSGTFGATIFDPSDDALYWSSPTLPEGWDTINQYRRVLQNQSDRPSGLMSNGEDLLIFGQRTVRRLSYNLDPGRATLDNLPTDNGVFNQRCLVQVDGTHLGFGRNGVWKMSGLLPRIISQPVADTLDTMDAAYLAKFHAAWDPYLRLAMFFFVETGDTEPKKAVVLDLDTGKWSKWTWPCGIIGSVSAADDNGLMRLYLTDINGYLWLSTVGEADGVEPTYDRILTVAAGSTATVVNVDEMLQTSPSLAGVYVYRPATGEEKLISANTGSQLTCAAFSTAPSVGEELWIGRIPWAWRTKWVRRASDSKERMTDLALEFIPDATGCEIKVSTYIDGNATPTAYSKQSSDQDPRGVITTAGQAAATVTTDTVTVPEGRATIPVPVNWHRIMSLRLECDNPNGDLEVVAIAPTTKPSKEEVE